MLARSWFDALKSCFIQAPVRRQRRAAGQHGPAVRRFRLETLEDRRVLAFDLAVDYPAGASPQAIVSADFNNDTVLDLAVANAYDVSILLGNPDGTFQPAQTAASGTYPLSLAVGDFNADGKLDIATDDDYAVRVLLGIGNGAFQAAPIITSFGSNPGSVAVGDFNADGKLDLGVLSTYGGDTYTNAAFYASVLLGNGDGSFSEQTTTGLVGGSSVAVADFNGDGKLDFATAMYGYYAPVQASVSVLLGDGLGNLQPPTDFSTGVVTSSVAVGDVNGDGKPDLVVAGSHVNNPQFGCVGVLLGNGLGSFGAAQFYATGDYPDSVVLGDFNRDGQVDLVLTGTHDNVSVLLGIGGGAFSAPRLFAAGFNPGAVIAGDFNGDDWLDAATTNYSSDGVSVLINDTYWPPADAPSIIVNDVNVTEGNTGTVSATFTVSLSAAYGQPVTVHFTTADGSATAGSDYTAGSGDVTFAPGETSKSISVAVIGDRLPEPTETFVVNLSAAANGFIVDSQGVGTIVDDEPRVGINDVAMNEGNSGLTAFAFTVSLSVAYDVTLTVGYATANGTATAGSDYQAASGTLTIPAGQTSGTIIVLVNGDRLVEPDKTFFVNLSNLNYGVIADGQSVGTIVDDEPRISIGDVTKKEGNGKKTTLFTFTVTLSAAYDQPVTMSYRTANGTATTGNDDYVAKTGMLTFAPGQITKTITIEVKGDSKREGNETFYLDLFGNSGNSLFTKNRGIGSILNDD